jgi:hypothetical protein
MNTSKKMSKTVKVAFSGAVLAAGFLASIGASQACWCGGVGVKFKCVIKNGLFQCDKVDRP